MLIPKADDRFDRHLKRLEERDAIAKRAFELRAELADYDAFDRIMNRKTDAPSRKADRLD